MTLGYDQAPSQKVLIQASPFNDFFSAPTHNLFQVSNVEKSLAPMYQIDGPQAPVDGWSDLFPSGFGDFDHIQHA
jgi:hypothetical protein